MDRGFKILYWAGGGVVFLLVIILALAVMVPKIVDSGWLKATIRTAVARQVKGDFNFQNAELSILPAPAVSLQQVSLDIPETMRVTLDSLRVYPRLLPLLVGKITIAEAVVAEPDFTMPLPRKKEGKSPPEGPFIFSEVLESLAAKLSGVIAAIPGLTIGIHEGTLRLMAGQEQVFLFENLQGSLEAGDKTLTAAISCGSNIWESMELTATLVPASREGNVGIILKNFNNKLLADYFLADKHSLAGGSIARLQADFSVREDTGIIADIKSSGATFSVLHKDKETTAKVENLKGSLQYSDKINALTIDTFTFAYPHAQLSGEYKFDRAASLASLDINAQDSDITEVHEILPEFINVLYGDLPVLQEIFDKVRGGMIDRAAIHVEGRSPADFSIFEAMQIQGHIEDAHISLSDLGLDLQGVTGDIAVARGVLEGKNLQARLGNSTGSDGTLKLGLVQKKTTPFHLDINLNADLAEVPSILKKLVPEKQVIEYLSLLESIEGTGQGRLTLGESLESLSARVEMNKISLHADYRPIPFPIVIESGRILYDGLKTQTFNLQGRVGKSTFSDYSSYMNFEGEPTIEVTSGFFQIVLQEIYHWLEKDPRMPEGFTNFNKAAGLIGVTVKSLKGPFMQPAKLQYELHCDLQSVDLDASPLPGPLNIKTGQADIVPDKITFTGIQAGLLDSSLAFSGDLQNFFTNKYKGDFIVSDATIGEEVNSWLARQIEMPKEYIFRTPLVVSQSKIKWIRGEMLDLQGDFAVKNGPVFSLDILLDRDDVVLRDLAIRNDDEQASLKLEFAKKIIGAEFQGSLSQKTINGILRHDDIFPNAWIKGGINLHIDMDSPEKSAAAGKLDGGNFIIPWKPDRHILLHSFSFSAHDKTLDLHSAEAVFEDTNYSLDGQATLSQKLLSVDLNVRTDAVELGKILAAQKENGEEKAESEAETKVGKFWDLALQGKINLHAGSLHYRKYAWQPFESQITYDNESLVIEILEKTELCNISTPGNITFNDDNISLNFRMEAVNEEYQQVLICLDGGAKQMTGILNMQANISGHGATKDVLANSLQGNLHFIATDGYIFEDARAAKLLYVLNVSNIFRDKIPDLDKKGFHYDSLLVKGTMDRGVLSLAPVKLEAPIMQIAGKGSIDLPGEMVDIKLLVAPLQTINKIHDLPIIRTIIPSNLIALPVEVKGGFSDIKVRALSMSAIGSNLFDFMVGALTTPVRALEKTPEE